MNKFQKVSFNSVEDFLAFLPEDELRIVSALRSLVWEVMPEAKEKLAYNVPCYSVHKNIFHIWPSSIPWGGLKAGSGVAVGFHQGKLLSEAGFELNFGNRKNIGIAMLQNLRDIHTKEIRQMLFTAYEIDQNWR